MKHQPATALPNECGHRWVVAEIQGFDVEVCRYCGTPKPIVPNWDKYHLPVVERSAIAETERRANAYPRLVEFIKRTQYPGDKHWPEMRALLRELGEDV